MYFFFFFFFFNTNMFEIFFKLNLNDSFLNIIHFFWINHIYVILIFFFLLAFLLIYNNNEYLIIFKLPVFFLFFTYYLENIVFYVLANKQLLTLNFSQINFNPFLFNNLNKYHPLFFYINFLFFIFFIKILWQVKLFNNMIYNTTKELLWFNFFFIFNLLCVLILLFLGGWWAFQENTWGGWWNWDISEYLGFYLLYNIVILLHMLKIRLNLLVVYFISYMSLLTFLILYYFIQINFNLTSHNFGLRFFFFFNNNFLYVELIFSLFYLIFLNFNAKIKFYINFKFVASLVPNKKIKNKIYFKLAVYLFISYLFIFFLFLIFSLNTSVSNFNQALVKLHYFFIIFNWSTLLIFATLIPLLTMFLKFLLVYTCIHLFINSYAHACVLFFFIYFKNSITIFLHFFLFNFFIINLFILNFDILVINFQNFLFSLNISKSSLIFTLNNDLIYFINQSTKDLITYYDWKYLYHTDMYSFLFTNNRSNFNLHTNFSYFYKTIFIKNKANNSLWLVFLLFFNILVFFNFKKQKFFF